MKKLKLRFKRALFAFFKEDILKEVGYKRPLRTVEIKSEFLNVKELKSVILIDNIRMSNDPIESFSYHNAVERAKKELFKECLKYIIVDSQSVMNPEIYNATAIKVSLFIGNKEW